MESFKGNAPGNESFGRASVPSARLRAQTAILYYRVRNSPVPVGSGRDSSETGVISQQRLSTRRCTEWFLDTYQMELAGGIRGRTFPNLEGRQDCAAYFERIPARCTGEGKLLGLPEPANQLSPASFQQPRQKLSSDCRHLHISPLHIDLLLAVEHSGQPHQDDRRTSRALFCTVAHAVAILAEICRHQGNVLHRGVYHWFTPTLLRCEESSRDTAPIGSIDLRRLHLAWMDAIRRN
jgi:hypothetical protein